MLCQQRPVISSKKTQRPTHRQGQGECEQRQHNHPREKKTPQGGQKPQSTKRQPPTTTTKRKKNTPAGRSPGASKDKLQPQPATSTNCCGQKPEGAKRNAYRNDQTARRKPRAMKCGAAANAALCGTVTLAMAWGRGWREEPFCEMSHAPATLEWPDLPPI